MEKRKKKTLMTTSFLDRAFKRTASTQLFWARDMIRINAFTRKREKMDVKCTRFMLLANGFSRLPSLSLPSAATTMAASFREVAFFHRRLWRLHVVLSRWNYFGRMTRENAVDKIDCEKERAPGYSHKYLNVGALGYSCVAFIDKLREWRHFFFFFFFIVSLSDRGYGNLLRRT